MKYKKGSVILCQSRFPDQVSLVINVDEKITNKNSSEKIIDKNGSEYSIKDLKQRYKAFYIM